MTTYSNREHSRDIKSDFSQCLPNCEKRVTNQFNRLLQVIKFWKMRSYERRQLAKLDERMLKDIGVSNFDAKIEIEKSFWQ